VLKLSFVEGAASYLSVARETPLLSVLGVKTALNNMAARIVFAVERKGSMKRTTFARTAKASSFGR